MISGLNSTGHEIGGTVGIAIFSTIAAGAAPSPAAGRVRDRARLRRSRSPRWCRQPGRSGCAAAGTPLRAEDAAEPQPDAEPLTMPKPTTAPAERPPPSAAAPTPNAASRPSSTPVSKRWRAIPTAACRRSLAARASSERPSTSTFRPVRLSSTPSWNAIAQVVEAMRGAEPHRGERRRRSSESSGPPGGSSRSSTAYSRSTSPGCRRRSSTGVTSPCSTRSSL